MASERHVIVAFRDKKFVYSKADGWNVDHATGRLTVTEGSAKLATFNTGVWDMVTFASTDPARMSASTASNNVNQVWNTTLKPAVEVDFKDPRNGR